MDGYWSLLYWYGSKDSNEKAVTKPKNPFSLF